MNKPQTTSFYFFVQRQTSNVSQDDGEEKGREVVDNSKMVSRPVLMEVGVQA